MQHPRDRATAIRGAVRRVYTLTLQPGGSFDLYLDFGGEPA